MSDPISEAEFNRRAADAAAARANTPHSHATLESLSARVNDAWWELTRMRRVLLANDEGLEKRVAALESQLKLTSGPQEVRVNPALRNHCELFHPDTPIQERQRIVELVGDNAKLRERVKLLETRTVQLSRQLSEELASAFVGMFEPEL